MKTKVILILFLFTSLISKAAEFPWFKHRQFEGWVETTQTTDNYIKVLPFVVAPGGLFWSKSDNPFGFTSLDSGTPVKNEGLEITTDNRLKFGHKIVTNPKYIPSNLKKIISKQINIPQSKIQNHKFSIIKVKNVIVSLIIGGKVVRKKEFTSDYIGGDLIDAFFFELDDYETLNKLRAGDFKLALSYDFPYSNFSSINIELNKKIITRAWVKAYRRIVKQIRKSGGSFLFFDWSSTVQRVYVEENLKYQVKNNINEKISVVMRDPTEDQKKRFETLLGFVKTTANNAIKMHTNAYKNAVSANKFNLAQAHKLYLDNIKAENSNSFSDELTKKLMELADDEVLGFMMAGMKINDSFGSSYYQYNGSSSMSATTTLKTEYSEYIIKNSFVSYLSYNFMPNGYKLDYIFNSAYELLNEKIFGVKWSSQIFKNNWRKGLLKSINTRDFGAVKYCINLDDSWLGASLAYKDINAKLDDNGNRPIHLAVKTKNKEIIRFLLKKGADPHLKNKFQESAFDLAKEIGNTSVLAILNQYKGKSGTAKIIITHPKVVEIGILWQSPEIQSISKNNVSNTKVELNLKSFPMYIDARGTINMRMWIKQSDINLFNVKPITLKYNGNSVLIQTSVMLNTDFKIRADEHINYEHKIVFENGTFVLK